MPGQFDVIVVGAGMAGIVASRDISAKGRSVLLLEARDRVGGRTYMEKAFDGEISLDLGGGYVHWTQSTVWHELERHGISIKPPLVGEKYLWFAGGKVHSGTEAEYNKIANPLLNRFFADARDRFPLPFELLTMDNSDVEKQCIEDRIKEMDLSPYERDILDGTLSGIVTSYTEQGVAHLIHAVATYFGDFKAFFETAGFWSIQGSTKALVNSIIAESTSELRLSTPVRSISDEGSQVVVMTDAGERIQARAVVVAVPLNSVGDIAIKPELPTAVSEMIQQRNPIKGGKIWIRVKGKIEPFNGVAPVGKSSINAFRTERRYKGDTLIMGICSDASDFRLDDLDAVQTVLRQFIPNIEVVDTAYHDWLTDKFSQGGWMMHRPGNLTNAAPQMREPHGRIQFAGGDIAILSPGSIDGAMHSGMLAARQVNASLATGKY